MDSPSWYRGCYMFCGSLVGNGYGCVQQFLDDYLEILKPTSQLGRLTSVIPGDKNPVLGSKRT